MSSYHTSFNYKDKNSFDEGLIIVAFEPDSGFKDSFLSMDNISDDYYDGTKRFDYGSKYSTAAEVQITLIKKDGSSVSLKEFRNYAKWLTGAKTNSWLEMCVYEHKKECIGNGVDQQYKLLDDNGKPFFGLIMVSIDNNRIKNFTYDNTTGVLLFDNVPAYGSKIEITIIPPIYSFLGKFVGLEHYKLDARTVGIRVTFSSVSPWAFSSPQIFDCDIGQALDVLEQGDDLIVIKQSSEDVPLGIDNNGVLSVNALDENSFFYVDEKGVAYVDTSYRTIIDNKSDDMYTYIDLDIDYINQNSTEVFIKNKTLNEETIINKLDPNEIISISAKQFIVSYSLNDKGERVQNIHKIFGDDFNFVWPRLAPGINDFEVYGSGHGKAQFTYRYPMKVGDCAIDIDEHGNAIYCDLDENYNKFTIDWTNIANTPTSIDGYGIADAYTDKQIDKIVENIKSICDSKDTSVSVQELSNMLAEILR